MSAHVPIIARVAAVRRPKDDTRSLAGTDYDGADLEGFRRQNMDWFYGGAWGGKMNLSTLDGQIDGVARVRFLFFKKTFRQKIYDFKGFTGEFISFGGSAGDPLTVAETYGSLSDSFAFTDINPLNGTEVISNPDLNRNYPHTLDRKRLCNIIP
jgi:hypothetical protein